jgi:hypothetical protein
MTGRGNPSRAMTYTAGTSRQPFIDLTASFTTCSKATLYVTSMTMWTKICLIALSTATAYTGLVVPDAFALGRRDEQNAARAAMLDGRVMPFAVIKRRVEREMNDATYLGSEFHQETNRYRLKYVQDGRVVWVDVDGRTGDIAGWAR